MQNPWKPSVAGSYKCRNKPERGPWATSGSLSLGHNGEIRSALLGSYD